MRRSLLLLLAIAFLAGCASSAPAPAPSDRIVGLASWYGEEYAGRTTANGEIFNPSGLTAAHRTLPFGTVLDVTNPANGKSVRVRINDRGPFVGDRILDLSYGAALQIGMVEAGIARIEARIAAVGRGDLDPPRPYVVKIAPPDETIRAPEQAPPVEFPLPSGERATVTESAPAADDDVVEDIMVIEERGGEPVRRQVSADGTRIETVTESGRVVATAPPRPIPPRITVENRPAPRSGWVVQLGAFSVPANAEALRVKASRIDGKVYVDQRGSLQRVRVGPFPSREAAIDASERLEAAGLGGIVLSLD
ncbi:MAG: septal ring lytic transglycosylase RlpA family protein [Thermoanaerobaculia bacterium]